MNRGFLSLDGGDLSAVRLPVLRKQTGFLMKLMPSRMGQGGFGALVVSASLVTSRVNPPQGLRVAPLAPQC